MIKLHPVGTYFVDITTGKHGVIIGLPAFARNLTYPTSNAAVYRVRYVDGSWDSLHHHYIEAQEEVVTVGDFYPVEHVWVYTYGVEDPEPGREYAFARSSCGCEGKGKYHTMCCREVNVPEGWKPARPPHLTGDGWFQLFIK